MTYMYSMDPERIARMRRIRKTYWRETFWEIAPAIFLGAVTAVALLFLGH